VLERPDPNNPGMWQKFHENIPFNSRCTKHYVNIAVSPGNIAKTILDELEGFNHLTC
jgi:hypothetical protein